MAGQEIYLGKMIEALQADIATMVSAMASQTNSLVNIVNSTAQGINALKVKPSNTKRYEVVGSTKRISANVPVNSTFEVIKTYNCLCEGAIKLEGLAGYSYNAYNSYLAYRINNGTIIKGNPGKGAMVSSTFNIAIAKGDKIEIGVFSDTSGWPSWCQDINIYYDLVDLINEGAMIQI